MSDLIGKDQVIAWMAEAVEERGEGYVYPSEATGGCSYRWLPEDEREGNGKAGEAACLVGVVFGKAGLLDELIPQRDYHAFDRHVFDLNLKTVGQLDDRGLLREHFTPEAIEAMREGQRIQDEGNPWGEAFYAAQLTGVAL